ncbi:protein SSUH2 homolog isoform X2 [Latimeria chalumnae]|uniref:protein SSUH2 homolog isoform X2 n=1 Tax=Latimeria chalumnae TaxID=7897 RepID=UPI00313D459D
MERGAGGISDTECDVEGSSTPPANVFDTVAGYEGTTADEGGKTLPPPPAYTRKLGGDDPRPLPPQCRIPKVTEDVAREALLEFASSRCCYSNKPARDMKFQELKALTTYRYRLETFTETRSSEWVFKPYTNQSVDGWKYGFPPPPWEVVVQPPPVYQDDVKKVRVPHSSSVKTCHRCRGRGRFKCGRCYGTKKAKCTYCDGSGRLRHHRECTNCTGTGRARCHSCLGRGSTFCSLCIGQRRLLHFIVLTVTWKNNVFEYVPDHQPGFPVALFNEVQGENIFEDENFLRQIVERIPLTEIYYEHKRKTYSYFIFGTENRVYTLNYPGKLSVCTIL